MNSYIGVDPGQSGAVAVVHDDGGHEVFDWPGDPGPVVDKVREWLLAYQVKLAAIEHVHSMPKQGVSSTFKFGTNFGVWLGVMAALGVPYLLVTPRAWQQGLVLPSAGATSKERSLSVARSLFPDAELSRQKDHGRADALLLGWWAKGQAGGSWRASPRMATAPPLPEGWRGPIPIDPSELAGLELPLE